MKMTGLQSIDT